MEAVQTEKAAGEAVQTAQLGHTTATTAGEPVSVANGEYLETWRDFEVPGAGAFAFDGARYMGLKLPEAQGYVGPLGPCQISAFDEYLDNFAPGELAFHQADGTRIVFDRPFNFLPSENAAYPHLQLFAPWLKQLKLKDRAVFKYFRQFGDGIYRLERIENLNGDVLTFTRDEAGLLTVIARDDSLKLVFTNSAAGRRLSITLLGLDGTPLELARYIYDARGRMAEANCAFGMSVSYRWHETRNLLEHWHNRTKRSHTTFTYDEAGRVTNTRTSGLWNNDGFVYDEDKRVTTYVPAGEAARAQRFEYDANENVTAEIDALGAATRHVFDKLGFRTATTDAEGGQSRTRYDVFGNIKTHTDEEGRETIYGWGPEGQLDILIDPAGNLRKNEYDAQANIVAQIDAEGHRTKILRDARGRVRRIVQPDGASERRDYDAHGQLESIRDAKGGLTRLGWDAFGRLVEVEDAEGRKTAYTYAAGAGGFATPTAITRPDGVTVSRGFDAEGALAVVTDGEGRSWRYSYGAFDVLIAITDPKGGTLRLAYDSEGRLMEVTNALGARYRLERDVAGHIVAEVDFDGRRTTYRRDRVGRMTEKIKPDGARLTYVYDKSGLLLKIDAFAPPVGGVIPQAPEDTVTYAYDHRGLLVEAKNAAARVEYLRDKNGRVIEEDINGRRIKSRYDTRGRRIERRVFTGVDRPETTRLGEHIARYEHDPLGAIARIAIGDHAPLAFERDALSRERSRQSGAGFALTQEYDPAGQLLAQAFGRRGGTPHRRRFAWDRAGAPAGIEDDLWGLTTYRHDANGQTVEAAHGAKTTRGALGADPDSWWRDPGQAREAERFAYDAARNIQASGGGAGGVAGPAGWLSSVGGVVRAARGPSGERILLTHDACGRVIERRVERDGLRPRIWRYGWDAQDRLVTCLTPEEERWHYRYDPFGRRIEKRRELPPPPRGQVQRAPRRAGTVFTWDGDVVAEDIPLNEDGTLDLESRTDWHFEPDSFIPLAKVAHGSRAMPPAPGTLDPRREKTAELSYIVTDHLGTPREIVSEAGELEWAASYRLWGSVRAVQGRARQLANGAGVWGEPEVESRSSHAETEPCPLRFPGQWEDAETGLYYNRHRHYDPLVGLYTSPDPIGLAGGSRSQGYVDCPSVDIDPMGLQARDATGKFLGKNGENLAGPGKLFEDAVADAFRAKGDTVFREVTIRNAEGKIVSRADSVVVREGKVSFVVEAKSGRKGLSEGQRQVQEMINNKQPFSFSGKNAVGIPGANTTQTFPGVTFERLTPGAQIP